MINNLYTSTLLPQTADPVEIQKAILDLLKKINELSSVTSTILIDAAVKSDTYSKEQIQTIINGLIAKINEMKDGSANTVNSKNMTKPAIDNSGLF